MLPSDALSLVLGPSLSSRAELFVGLLSENGYRAPSGSITDSILTSILAISLWSLFSIPTEINTQSGLLPQ